MIFYGKFHKKTKIIYSSVFVTTFISIANSSFESTSNITLEDLFSFRSQAEVKFPKISVNEGLLLGSTTKH